MAKQILLLHGALGSKNQFASITPLLNAEIHAINFTGHGGLPLTKAFTMQQFAQDVIEYLDENNIEKIDVFGYSLGGYVALYTAFLFPNRIGKIATLSTKMEWTPEFTQDQVRMLNPEIIAVKVPKFADQLSHEHQPEDWKTIMEKTADMMVGLSLTRPLSDNSLRQIAHPVILGAGNRDQMVSIEETLKAAKCLQKATVCILDTPHEIAKIDVQVLADFITESLI